MRIFRISLNTLSLRRSSRLISSSAVAEVINALTQLKDHTGRPFKLSFSSSREVNLEVQAPSSSEWQSLFKTDAPDDVGQLLKKAESQVNSTMPSSFLVSQPSPNLMTNIIFDPRSVERDPRMEAEEKIKINFPRLTIHTTHTAATDLQGNKTHTVSVELKPVDSTISLSSEEEKAVKAFHGESAGLGYRGTLRRALSIAFNELGKVISSIKGLDDTISSSCGTSVIQLYASISTEGLSLRWDKDQSTMAIFNTAGQVLSQVHHKSPIIALLTAMESAIQKVNPKSASEIQRQIQESGLYVLLPDRGVNLKDVLGKILHFFLGVLPSGLIIEQSAANGLFSVVVKVIIPLQMVGLGHEDLNITLSTATGRSKKDAVDLSLVKAIEYHFPRLFEDQISFHSEIQKICSSEKASESGQIGPHISRGLLCQLEWACKNEGTVFTIDSERLIAAKAPNGNSKDATVGTSWRTTLSMYQEDSSHSIGEVIQHSKPIWFVVTEDSKKSRSVQKAIAAAIAQRFPNVCREAVAYAIGQRLIDSTGKVVIAEKPLETSIPFLEIGNADFINDPLIRELNVIPYQWIKGNEPFEEIPLLEQLRAWAQCFAQQKYHSPLARMEERLHCDGVQTTVALSASLQCTEGFEMERLEYGSATHAQPLRAIFLAYIKLLKSFGDEEEVKKILSLQTKLIDEVPDIFPSSLPLSTITQLVMNFYGCAIKMNICSTKNSTVVQFFASERNRAEEEGVSETSEAITEKDIYLGQGEGINASHATVSCCEDVFVNHFKVLKCAFPELPLKKVFTSLVVESHSLMFSLLQSVIDEIKLTAPSNMTIQEEFLLTFEKHPRSPISVMLAIAVGDKKIELERSDGVDFVDVMQKFCESVCKETNFPFTFPKGMAEPNLSHFQRISTLFSKLFGLAVVYSTARVDDQWFTRLSLALGNEYMWCLCHNSASKKNDATEAGALFVLRRYFPKVFTDLSPTSSLLAICDTKTTFGGYFYLE